MKIKTFRVLFMILVTAAVFLGAGRKASAASVTLTVAADKTEAKPGDVIDLSITLGPVSEMGTMQMVIVIPDGLSYVQGSGALAPGLKEKLGYDIVDFTEISMMVNGVASAKDYSSEEDTLLCTFSCTVDEGFHGVAEVGLKRLEFYSCQTWQDHTSEYSVVPAVIAVPEEEPVEYRLDKTFVNIAVNDSVRLNLIGTDGSYGEGTWTSEDETAASVDEDGTVKAHKYHTGTIKIHVSMDNGYEGDCEVQTRFWDVNGSNVSSDEDYQYYYDAVYWGADHEPYVITKGYDLQYFGVSEGCKRQDFILFLYRLAGQPAVSDRDLKNLPSTFSDIPDDLKASFRKAIVWGYGKGIVKGYSDGTFGCARTIDRREAILMIWRFAGRPASESTPKFEAFDEIRNNRYKPTSDTYKAIRWAAATGLSNGYQRASSLPPGIDISTPCYGSDLVCRREDMIVFLYRYAQKFLGEN